ncbi:MAG: hypothetical protein ACXVLQ_12125 [Bacteriovorax sp.]
MKILKRNYGLRNLLIFLTLSLVYLQAVSSLSIGSSLFSLASLRSFFVDHSIILAITSLTVFMVVKIKKYSEILLLLCLTMIVGKSFILLSGSFNKLTLVLNFIYLVFAFYFFVSWELEVALASYNPLFSIYDLEKEPRFKLTANISPSEDGSGAAQARITNIDEESCFLLLAPGADFELNTSRKYYLDANFEGVHFRQRAQLVSRYDRGVGLVFEDFPDARVSWSVLYKVCLERGLMS